MAYYKRRRSRPKRSSRRKMYKKRRLRRSRIPRSMLNGNRLHVKLRMPDELVTNNNLAPTLRALTFSLNQCTNMGNYTAIWDQYRINKVVLKIRPIRTQQVEANINDVITGSVTNIPSIVVAKDYDDSLTTSFDNLCARAGSKRCLMTRGMTYTLVPATLTELYNTSATSAYAPKYKTWLDCAYNGVPHYGLKIACEPAEPTGQYGSELQVYVYVSFKNRFH